MKDSIKEAECLYNQIKEDSMLLVAFNNYFEELKEVIQCYADFNILGLITLYPIVVAVKTIVHTFGFILVTTCIIFIRSLLLCVLSAAVLFGLIVGLFLKKK